MPPDINEIELNFTCGFEDEDFNELPIEHEYVEKSIIQP